MNVTNLQEDADSIHIQYCSKPYASCHKTALASDSAVSVFSVLACHLHVTSAPFHCSVTAQQVRHWVSAVVLSIGCDAPAAGLLGLGSRMCTVGGKSSAASALCTASSMDAARR